MVRSISAKCADSNRLIGAYVLASVHGTSISNRVHAISGDWMSLTSVALEREMADTVGAPVVAFGSGAQADSNTCLPSDFTMSYPKMIRDIKARADSWSFQFTRAIVERWKPIVRAAADADSPVDDPELHIGYHVADPKGASVATGYLNCRDTLPSVRHLADDPETGAAVLGGSELADLSRGNEAIAANEGRRRRKPKAEHGFKKVSFLGRGRTKPTTVPRNLPFRVVQFRSGTTVAACLVGCSGEVTAYLSSWVAEDVRDRLGSAMAAEAPMLLSAVTGEYSGYWTTGPEYDLQHYEGASTLWGLASGGFLRQNVVAALGSSPEVEERDLRFYGNCRFHVQNYYLESSLAMREGDFPWLAVRRLTDSGTDTYEIVVRFETNPKIEATPALCLSPTLTLVRKKGNRWVAENDRAGRRLDDRTYPCTIETNIDRASNRYLDGIWWTIRWHIPVDEVQSRDASPYVQLRLGNRTKRFTPSSWP